MKIGELAKRSGSNVETVRYYERIGLLAPPARTDANYRNYSPADVQRLSFVRRARNLGFTLDDVRELLTLADDGAQSCAAIDALAARHRTAVHRKIADLTALGTELDRVVESCGQGVVADCHILEALAGGATVLLATRRGPLPSQHAASDLKVL